MDSVTKRLLKEYRIRGRDFIGYRVDRGNVSYHHIEKRSEGGKRTFENGSILNGNSSHPYIHIVEGLDLEIYGYIKERLKEIHRLGRVLSVEELSGIYCLLESFEKEYCSAKSSNGNYLIKEEFIKGRVLTKEKGFIYNGIGSNNI